MSLIRYSPATDPFDSLLRLQGQFLRAFEGPRRPRATAGSVLRADADESGYSIRLEIPGVAPERVSVETRDHVLSIEVRREGGEEPGEIELSRTVRLPNDADPAHTEAVHRYGVLEIRVPRREEARPRQIPVSSA